MGAAPDWVTPRGFLAALETGSIIRAAGHCDIAVSAAAKRIQALEAESVVPLLERGARGVRPTAAGEAFARHVRALLHLAAHLAARLDGDLRAFAAGGTGSVRLHATPSAIAGHDLAEALARFAAERPGVRVELREEISLAILQELLDGRADLGVATATGRVPAGLQAHPWRRDRLLVAVAVARGHGGHTIRPCARPRVWPPRDGRRGG